MSRVRCLRDFVSWPCVGAQVEDESHVVIWTACIKHTISMKLVVNFVPSTGMSIHWWQH